jgi:uncharacterized protein
MGRRSHVQARGDMMEASFLAPRHGARPRWAAAGKAAAYLLLALIGALLVSAAAKGLLGASLLQLAQGDATAGLIRAGLLLVGVVVFPTTLVLLIFREPFQLTGWSMSDAGRWLGWGLVTGLGLLSAVAGGLWLAGAATFHVTTPDPATAASALAIAAPLWLAQAAGEEGLHRGYAFVQACRAIAFWPAAVLGSGWFLLGHIGNPGETLPGLIVAGLFGLALAYSLLRTGSLWFALGFHAAWNFAQSFVFGFRNSGSEPPASLLSPRVEGAAWLTGGATGPEASVLMIPALVILFAAIHRLSRRRFVRRGRGYWQD